ncbi:helix-turn-helix transcriptional regulator [Streptomyces sp. NPDC006530]|uniref:helix-turn-helix transcriptional regulator n=1 Tax=Streptomyces sp. NPDC006530 TaxID=3364750 RepID=UPI003691D703
MVSHVRHLRTGQEWGRWHAAVADEQAGAGGTAEEQPMARGTAAEQAVARDTATGHDEALRTGAGRTAQATARDTAAEHEAAADLGAWRNHFLTLLDRIALPIAVCSIYGDVHVANPAMAAEWGTTPGRLRGRPLRERFTPRSEDQLDRLVRALRTGRTSRYPIEVTWRSGRDGAEREGEFTIDPIMAVPEPAPVLLAMLYVRDERPEPPPLPGGSVSGVQARILALAASGATTAAIGKALGLTVDGVNYHLTRLSQRWRVQGRTALVAKAYALGVLAPGRWPPEPAGGLNAP